MTNTTYVALSRQIGLAKALNGIANNIANADTTGFRAETAIFSEYISALSNDPSISQTRLAGRAIDEKSGPLRQTGAPLDVAIEGEGYFVVLTPHGERLTRAGAFSLNAEGALVTPEGHPVAGEGGAAIELPPGAVSIAIGADGSISADGAPAAKLAVVAAAPETLAREGSLLFRPDGEVVVAESARVRQGFVEASNVNSVLAIASLIETQRAFEMNQQLMNDEHQREKTAVESIGGRA
jgi:flagellar basal-body rod protein FlgF